MHQIQLYLLFCLAACCTGSTLYVNEESVLEFNTPTFDMGPQKFDVVHGSLVRAIPFSGCSDFENEEEIRGNVVFLDRDGCWPQEKMRRCQRAGAKAVLIKGVWAKEGFGYFQNDNKDNRDIVLPALEVAPGEADDISDILSANLGQNVTLAMRPGENKFKELWKDTGAWLFFTLINAILSAVVIGLSVFRLVTFIKVYGPEFSITQISLVLHAMGATLRLTLCIDPVGVNQWFTFLAWFSLMPISFPFTLAVNILAAFYWAEMLFSSKIVVASVHLRSFWIPCGVVIALAFLGELVSVILRSLFVAALPVIIAGSILSWIVSLGIGVFFVFTGIRVIYFVRAVKKQLLKITWFVLFGGIGLLFFNVIMLIVSVGGLDSAVGFYVLTVIMFIALSLISLSQVAILSAKKPTSSSSPSHSAQRSATAHDTESMT